MKKIIFCFVFFTFSLCHSKEIKLRSVIILENNVPNECGIAIDIIDKDISSSVKVSIKKNENNTSTYFSAISNSLIAFADIVTQSEAISKIIKLKNKRNDFFEIESETDQNRTNQFFQELIISGAQVFIENKKYEIMAPIDSKVRLEYLFCTGEMFLPNYESNKK